ncbi:MAG: hypothetical protein J5775_03865 [Spirochaetales bacterium]|nr:hypothetical protein [Spirochaetales bacterium]
MRAFHLPSRAFRVLAIVSVLCLVSVCAASGSYRFGFAGDLGFAQDFIFGEGSNSIQIDLRAMVSDEFQVRIPLGLSFNGPSFMAEAGLFVLYYPWKTGPFMGLSVFQFGFTGGSCELENMVNLNEVTVGWTFEFGPGLFVEPSLSIRDPSGTFSDEYSGIKGVFPCYTVFRGRFSFGWYFWR